MLALAHPLASLLALAAAGPIVGWEAAAGCPTEESVQAEVRRELHDAPDGPQWRIQGTVTATGELFLLEITVSDPIFGTSRRSEEAGNCGDLAQAFILHIRQFWLSRAVAPTPWERRTHRRIRVVGDLGGLLFPNKGLHGGGQIVFGLAWRRARVEFGIGADGRGGVSVFGRSTIWVRPFLLARGCRELASGPVEFHLCAGAAGGVVLVVDYRPHRLQPTFDLHAAPAITWWFHRRVGLWVGVTGGVLLPFLKPFISHDGKGRFLDRSELKESNNFFIEGSVGFEFRWGQ